ncbi:MAG: MFS transporter [Geminicoccaceae bacterium]|nr:MFS transporter [Geminicoccaceae bacterium]MCS7267138.1 MFS transporter [Geminicoccaceae bacterium]MCX7629952.1 MFS transporter [Geminicoccaceae bacterium]MDW8125723.1 MFS transporter [Geminicoccaceae bacterium]MDW8342684.1 MFS transporter [Geminicoccaceae bacterium]
MATLALTASRGRETALIVLVSAAHFFSHLYILILPPLFPVLAAELGAGVAALGFALALMNLVTILAQPPLGFLVDRLGAGPILVLGHCAMAAGIGAIALVSSYPALLLCVLLAGLGNAVYHPADYALLAAGVGRERRARAFAVHTFGGFLGFAAAPAAIVPLATACGWRWALAIAAGLGLLLGLVLAGARALRASAPAEAGPGRARTAVDSRLLASRPILLALGFFFLLAASNAGITGFTVVVLERLRGLDLLAASFPLSVFLFASAAGVLFGGWLADRARRHATIVGVCALLVAAQALAVAFLALPYPLLLGLFLSSGFAAGTIAPARDMLVAAVTPAGATGRVFGFVMIGFNLGGLFAPPLYGFLVDAGRAELVFLLVAGASLLAIATVRGTRADAKAP